MKHAAAMKYGGELVAAEDCNYDSFKELVPLCPNCKEPVFLRAGSDHISPKGTEFKIGPHWCHFKGVSAEQIASCESRVSSYTDKDRQRIAAQARGQRLKLLQRWFWSVLIEYHDKSFEGGIEGVANKVKPLVPAFKDWFLEFIEREKEAGDPKNEMNVTFSRIVEGHLNRQVITFPAKVHIASNGDLISDSLTNEEERLNALPIFPSIQRQMVDTDVIPSMPRLHKDICKEVLSFLFSKSNRDLMILLLSLGAWENIDFADQMPWYNPPGFHVFRVEGTLYVETPMTSQEAKSGLTKSAKGFGKHQLSDKERMTAIQQWSWFYQVAQLHLFYLIASIPWASEFQRLEAESKKGAA